MVALKPFTIDTESLGEAMRVAMEPILRTMKLHTIAAEGLQEVERARTKHGAQRGLPDGTGPGVVFEQLPLMPSTSAVEWANLCKYLTDKRAAAGEVTRADIVLEEIAEAFAEDDPQALRAELIQGVAMLMAWIYDIDLR